LAIFVIAIGIIKGLIIYTRRAVFATDSSLGMKQSRFELGHAFSLGLGFLIGAIILKTSTAPSWTDIGQLASIIAIRTILNYLLTLEVSKHTSDLVKSFPEMMAGDKKKEA